MCSCEPILVVLRSLELGHPGLYPWPLKGWRWRARDGPLLNEWIAREMQRNFCPCFVKSLADCFQSIRAEGGSIDELAGLHGRDPCSSKCSPSSTSVTGQAGLSIGVSRLKWKGRRCLALFDDGSSLTRQCAMLGHARCYSKARGVTQGVSYGFAQCMLYGFAQTSPPA